MVLDPVKGFALEHVENPQGRQWRYGKSLVHLVKRVEEGGVEKLIPVELPLEMGIPPEKLYRALFWDKLAGILFTVTSSLLEKLKVIGMYVLIGHTAAFNLPGIQFNGGSVMQRRGVDSPGSKTNTRGNGGFPLMTRVPGKG